MSDKYSRKQVKLESKPLLSPDILSDINKWNSNRQAMVTEYYFDNANGGCILIKINNIFIYQFDYN